jgi:hypothetical protein
VPFMDDAVRSKGERVRGEDEKIFSCRVLVFAHLPPFTSSGAFCYRGKIAAVARSPSWKTES